MFELLGLNRIAYLGKRLNKNAFYDNADLSKNDKKIFVDYIDRIEISYMINKSNLNIDAFINDEYAYEAIVYLKVSLKQDGKLDKINKIINNSIPSPIVIIYEFDGKYKISTAIKRLNKAEKNKTVIEEARTSPWIDIDNLSEGYSTFLESISLSKLPYTNLFDFYKTINDKIYIFKKSQGEYKNIDNKKELELSKDISEQIEKLENELKNILRKIKKESQFNKKMELNIKATQIDKEIKTLKEKLK